MSWFKQFGMPDEEEIVIPPDQDPPRQPEPQHKPEPDNHLAKLERAMELMIGNIQNLEQRVVTLEVDKRKMFALHADYHNLLNRVQDWHHKFDCLADALGVVVTSDKDGGAIVSTKYESLLVHARRYLSDQLAMAQAVQLQAREMEKRRERENKGRPSNLRRPPVL